MKVQIGMLIWKEMKSQGVSQAEFADILREKNIFIRNIFKMNIIDVYALVQISALLKINFFQYYEAEELNTLLQADENDSNKISSLKNIIREQNKLLLTHKKMIKQQDSLIEQLKVNCPEII